MSTPRLVSHVHEIVSLIRRIPGDKIITLQIANRPPFVVDVDAAGTFGYAPGLDALFAAKLMSALHEGGGLIVRQFLAIRVERTTPTGKRIWIPLKRVYGLCINPGGRWRALTTEEMQETHCTDPHTFTPIPPEPDVIFSSFTTS